MPVQKILLTRFDLDIDFLMRRFTAGKKALVLVWESAGIWAAGWLLLAVLRGVLPVGIVYLTKHLVNGLAEAVGAGLNWQSLEPVIIPAALMGIIMVLMQVFDLLATWIRTAMAELIQDHVKGLIHEQGGSVVLTFYESPDRIDGMQRANSQAGQSSLSLLQNIGGILTNLITLIGVAILLLAYSIWLPVLLVLSTLPALAILLRHHQLHHRWWKATTADRRWADYYDLYQTYNEPAQELRLLNLNKVFHANYQTVRARLRSSRLDLLRRQSLAQAGATFLGLLIMAAIIGWMVLRAVRGLAQLGDLALFYQAFNQGQSIMRSLMGNVGQLYADTLFLEHLFSFLDEEREDLASDDDDSEPLGIERAIELEDISFCYPGSDLLALDHFSLVIPRGKMVAIVGPNGAGKSTLLKLLCRFYEPREGSIKIDGVDIRELPLLRLRRMLSVLFQHPTRYVASAAENIAYGDYRGEVNREEVEAAGKEAGAHEFITRLPHGYDTLLSKLFENGAELSGGQKQRVALARAMYRKAPVVIFDEPTSFMDSWAEIEWLDRFCRHHERVNNTVVLITHRFTTAMRADVIYVMDNGRILESGSHEELLRQGGLYASSWASQVESHAQDPLRVVA